MTADVEFDAEMAPYVEMMRMALAEAGWPDAHVYVESGGIHVDHPVPPSLVHRVVALINEHDGRVGDHAFVTEFVTDGAAWRASRGAAPGSGA